jgi:hypothetical protein
MDSELVLRQNVENLVAEFKNVDKTTEILNQSDHARQAPPQVYYLCEVRFG